MSQPLKKIRVLFHVTHLHRGGGIESSLMSWLRVLDRDHYEPALSIAYPGADLEAVFRAQIPDDVAVTVLGAEGWLSACRQRKKQGRLGTLGLIYEEVLLPQVRKRVFRQRFLRLARQADMVVDYDLSLARFAPDFSAATGKPLVGISHFSLTQKLTPGVFDRRYRARANHYRRYDALVAICDAMRVEAGQFFPDFSDRVVTLYPGFDLDNTRRRSGEPASVSASVSASAPALPYLVTVTRLEESQKDVTTLLQAYAMLVSEHHVSEQLLIVGEGRDRARLETLAGELGISSQVRFAGFTSNPLPAVAGARLLVLSSKLEGLPTALIEGLILGKVLVASDCPTGPHEVLAAGQAGLLVEPGNATALCQALLAALRDAPLRQRLQMAALEHSQTFGMPAFHQRFNSLVHRLFAVQAGGPALLQAAGLGS